MNAARIATVLFLLAAGSAFGADKPACDLLTREQVAPVMGAGAIATLYVREELPQRRAKTKELTPVHICSWLIKEAQSAVEVHLVVALPEALVALSTHNKTRRDDEQDFGDVSCWSEGSQKLQFPNAACAGTVKGNALKVLFRSNTAMPTIQQAKSLFDQAAAGL